MKILEATPFSPQTNEHMTGPVRGNGRQRALVAGIVMGSLVGFGAACSSESGAPSTPAAITAESPSPQAPRTLLGQRDKLSERSQPRYAIEDLAYYRVKMPPAVKQRLTDGMTFPDFIIPPEAQWLKKYALNGDSVLIAGPYDRPDVLATLGEMPDRKLLLCVDPMVTIYSTDDTGPTVGRLSGQRAHEFTKQAIKIFQEEKPPADTVIEFGFTLSSDGKVQGVVAAEGIIIGGSGRKA